MSGIEPFIPLITTAGNIGAQAAGIGQPPTPGGQPTMTQPQTGGSPGAGQQLMQSIAQQQAQQQAMQQQQLQQMIAAMLQQQGGGF